MIWIAIIIYAVNKQEKLLVVTKTFIHINIRMYVCIYFKLRSNKREPQDFGSFLQFAGAHPICCFSLS
ncbi:hypothetical protein Hanom_Chr09g00852151 [Helianthus anomalus]